MRRIFFALFTTALTAVPAWAQLPGGGVSPVPPVTANDCVKWISPWQVGDAGAACAVGAGVTSFNTRTGAVTPQSGDYSVGQITGAAPLASPTFTGTVTIPNGAALGTPASLILTNATGLPNAGLLNSSITLGSTAMALGSTTSTIGGGVSWTGVQTFGNTAGTKATMTGSVSRSAWTTGGTGWTTSTGLTYTDTSSSGTVPAQYIHVLQSPTIAASSATTFTDSFDLFVARPLPGTNVTQTNAWGLGADSANINTLLRTTSNTSDGLTYLAYQAAYGANSHISRIGGQTTTGVSSSATTFFLAPADGCLIVVVGDDGAGDGFSDVVIGGLADTPAALISHTTKGAPAARTYINAGSGGLRVSVASGTYTVNAFGLAAGAR